MRSKNTNNSRRFTCREMLAFAIRATATATFTGAHAQSNTAPVLARAIPRTGEKLPVIGLGTAIIFDIGRNCAFRKCRHSVTAHDYPHTTLKRRRRQSANRQANRLVVDRYNSNGVVFIYPAGFSPSASR